MDKKHIIFSINSAPYSVNQYFYGNRSIKRKETVEWELTILEQLRYKQIQDDFQSLKSQFDPCKHSITVELDFYYPKDILFTKQKQISSRAFDVTNVEKPLIDLLFLKKYCTYNIKNMEIDDKYITKLISQKKHSENHRIDVKIELIDLQFD